MAQKKETSVKSASADTEKPSSKSVATESAKTGKPAAKATAEKKSAEKVSTKQAQQPDASSEDSAKVSSSVPTTPKKSASKTAAAKAEAAPKTKAAAVKEESEAKTPAVKAEKATKPKAATATAAPAPVELPKPKKPAVTPEAAPELVIKQVYNPAKMPPFIKKQQQRLIELRSSLMDSMDGVAKEVLRARPEGSDGSVGGMHMGDAGSDAYDRDFALSMLSKEQDALYEINEALTRVDAGVYGVCELSGLKIVEERLEALPYTRYTREMQEQIERDQMGGRFTRPVVRSVFGLEDDSDEDDEDDEEGNTSSSSNNNDSSLDFSKE